MQVKKIFGILVLFLWIMEIGNNVTKAVEMEDNQTEYDSVMQYVLTDGSERYINEGGMGADNDSARNVNVRAFKVSENGKVIILDAKQEKILTFMNSELVGSIDISFCIDPQYFTYENDVFIVFDLTSFGKLYYMNQNGDILKEIELPEDITPSTIAGFYKFEKESYLITYDKELIKVPDFESQGFLFDTVICEDNYLVRAGEFEWNLPRSNRQLFNPVYIDENGCLYIEETTIAQGTEYIQGETYLLKLDKNGNEIMSMRLRLEEYDNFPDQYYDFCEEELYVLELFEKKCQVSKVAMCKNREESLIAEMEKQSKTDIGCSVNERAEKIVVTRTRRQVESEIYGIVNAGWKVNAGNKTIVAGAALPKYIKETSVGNTVIGVPYCWGGYNALSSILGSLGSGRMAGNVNKVVVEGPVGFDCSGFVSYCYGLGSHIGTAEMEEKIALTTVDSSNMQSMDLLLKTGHVMLFAGYSGNYINVYESTTEGEQKARAYSYTLNLIFTEKKYKAYTPW